MTAEKDETIIGWVGLPEEVLGHVMTEVALARRARRSVAPVSESLPEGVTPNPQEYTLAAGVASPDEGWEYRRVDGYWDPCHGQVWSAPMTIRRVEAPPQPATEEVEVVRIDELIRLMVNDGVRPLAINGEAVAWWSINENGLSTSPHCDEDGYRTTWPRNVVAMVTVLRTDGTRPDTDRRQG